MQEAIDLLDNWGTHLGHHAGRIYGAIGMYLTPEERAQASRTCRPQRLSEADALRADAVIATLRQSNIYQSFVVLLEKHFMFRADQRRTCQKTGIGMDQYQGEIDKAVGIFWMQWQIFAEVPTKMIRMGMVNNRLTSPKSRINLATTT